MELFESQNFFDLSSFRYPSLFQKEKSVWSALFYLEEFLRKQPLGKIYGEVDPRAILINPEQIHIGKGTIVEAGAFIRGPCVIGEGCEVRHGAYIRGNFLAGDICVIGHGTEVKNAIFLDGAHAGHFAYVGDSILGNGVNLGAGTICANLRFDRKNIKVKAHFQQRALDTGLRKFGAIFGDKSQTGCNVVTNPGTILDKRTLIPPCQNVSGFISKKSAPEEILVS